MPLVTFDDRKIEVDVEGDTNSIRVGSALIQWGYVTASNSGYTNVTFDKTYSTAPYIQLTISGVTRTADTRTPQVYTATNTGFQFYVSAWNGSSNYYSGAGVNWIAIGTV